MSESGAFCALFIINLNEWRNWFCGAQSFRVFLFFLLVLQHTDEKSYIARCFLGISSEWHFIDSCKMSSIEKKSSWVKYWIHDIFCFFKWHNAYNIEAINWCVAFIKRYSGILHENYLIKKKKNFFGWFIVDVMSRYI